MTEKTFLDYIADKKNSYKYILKFAVSDMTDEMIDLLEQSLAKYQLKKASAFRKTPIQMSPLDFPNIKNMPVYICDIEMEYPSSLDFMRNYIANSLNISQSQLAVYSECDPRQIETDLFIDRTSPEYKEKYKALLGQDYEATAAPKYGEDYNLDFLKALDQVSKERKYTVADSPLNVSTELGKDLPSDYDSFNSKQNMPSSDIGLFGRIKKPGLPR